MGEVYAVLQAQEYEGYTYLIGVYSSLDVAKYEISNHCKNQHFMPDFIRVLKVPMDANFADYPDDYPTVLLLKKNEEMVEDTL